MERNLRKSITICITLQIKSVVVKSQKLENIGMDISRGATIYSHMQGKKCSLHKGLKLIMKITEFENVAKMQRFFIFAAEMYGFERF